MSALRGEDMTREEILAMSAGRELNALVAEKVLGLERKHDWRSGVFGHWFCFGCGMMMECTEMPQVVGKCPTSPRYSQNIEEAWKVGEAVGKYSWHVSHLATWWRCQIVTAPCLTKCFEAQADTAPLAICRAALLAVLGL